MELAKKQAAQTEIKDIKTIVPPQYHDYLSQFDKKSAERFPPSRPYDHEINLDDSFIPSDCKTYPLNPKQEKLLEQFLEDNLRKGYIRPSQSPQASSFFFVGVRIDAGGTAQSIPAMEKASESV